MTDLYVALDRDRRRVVIRFPKEKYARDRRLRAAFSHSAHVLRKLDHPNIARLIEVGKVGGAPFMVMPYAEARDLRELIVQRDPLLLANRLGIIRQIGAGLYHIHHRGYLHLDLKPENLLVHEDGHVLFIDFDLAMRWKGRPIKLKTVSGTPSYLAPEALTHHVADERSDIYSLGVTAYEIMTGHKPYEGDTADEVRKAQMDLRVHPAPMRKHNPEVPKALESVISKCLAKVPDNRYPSMSLVINHLEAMV